MVVIFSASTDLMSERRTSRFIGPVLRWLKPDISDAAMRRVQMLVRKTAHVTEYAVLGWLVLRALSRTAGWLPTARFGRRAAVAVLLCVLYAVSDEVHQSYVRSRHGSPYDVVLDAAGATVGVLLLGALGHWRGRRRARRC